MLFKIAIVLIMFIEAYKPDIYPASYSGVEKDAQLLKEGNENIFSDNEKIISTEFATLINVLVLK